MKINNLKKTLSRTFILFCAAGMVLTGCNKDEPKPDNPDIVGENNEVEPPVDNPPEVVIPTTPDDNPDVNDNPDDPNNGEENPDDVKEPDDKPVVSGPVKDSKIASYWSKLEKTAKSGQAYYSEYYTKTRVTTKNGYLYNYAASNQITPDYLVSENKLAAGNTSSDISIMLMYGTDIVYYGGDNVKITNTDREFTVFAFMKHPLENSYIFTSGGGSFGTLSANAYSRLMARYSMDHGTVRRLTPANTEYDRILSCIKMYESRYEQYFVRSITTDDKYAFVVLSGRANAATIREYILKNENGIWEVVMDDLETEGRLPVTVNKKIPDFNMQMLPTYAIKDFTMLTDYTGVMDALTKAGLYAKDDTFYYFCGTEDFCYMITDNGKRFLCRNNNGTWECSRVLDYYDALSRLQKYTNNPPTFILLDLE